MVSPNFPCSYLYHGLKVDFRFFDPTCQLLGVPFHVIMTEKVRYGRGLSMYFSLRNTSKDAPQQQPAVFQTWNSKVRNNYYFIDALSRMCAYQLFFAMPMHLFPSLFQLNCTVMVPSTFMKYFSAPFMSVTTSFALERHATRFQTSRGPQRTGDFCISWP